MKLFVSALAPQAQEVMKSLALLPLDDFYLAGGTGLALQIGHRVSLDFDFFSGENSLDFGGRRNVQASFAAALLPFQIQKEENGTLILSVEGIRVSFFSYGYSLIAPVVPVEGLRLASISDIGAMKAAAIVSRGSKRDFIDLYEISRMIPLKTLLDKASRKYARVSDFFFQALKGLAYFEDAEDEPMPQLLKPIEWGKIRTFFESETDKLAKEI